MTRDEEQRLSRGEYVLGDYVPRPADPAFPWRQLLAGGVVLGVGVLISWLAEGATWLAVAAICVGFWQVLAAVVKMINFEGSQPAAPYPSTLPTRDRSRLDQLAVAVDRYERRLSKITDPEVRQRMINALSDRPSDASDQTYGTEVLLPGEDALRIVISAGWRDPWLKDHRLDIDPLQEAIEIYGYLNRVGTKVTEFSANAEQHKETSVGQTYRQYVDDLTADLSAVRGRARALADYAGQIDRLSTVLEAESLRPQVERDGDTVRDLMAESRRHELAGQHLDHQRRELTQIESGLREIRSLLSDEQSLRLDRDPE